MSVSSYPDATPSPSTADAAPAQRRESDVATTIADRLRGLLPVSVWRTVAASIVCVLTVAALSGGLLLQLPSVQLGIIAGVIVALIVPGALPAGLTAAGATALGVLIAPASSFASSAITFPDRLQQMLVAAVIAAAVAAASALAIRTWRAAAAWSLCCLMLAVIFGNLLMTSLDLNDEATFNPATQSLVPSVNEQLAGATPPGSESNDHVFFSRVSRAVADGEPYYETFRELFVSWSGGRPPSAVTNFRFPLVFYVWGAFSGSRLVLVFFLLAAASTAAALFAATDFVKAPVLLPAAAALAGYFLFFMIRMSIYTAEAWAACAALLAVAAYIRSLGSDRWRAWVVASVVAAVLAVLTRETLAFVLLAGLASSLVVRDEQWVFRASAWAAGCAVAVAAIGTNYFFARPFADPASAYSQFTAGSLTNLVDGITYATDHLGFGGWLPFGLAVLGVAGVLLVPDRRLRLFLSVGTLPLLVAFVFFKNTTVDYQTGVGLNYWGAAAMPLLYAAIPYALLLIPGVRRGQRAGDRGV